MQGLPHVVAVSPGPQPLGKAAVGPDDGMWRVVVQGIAEGGGHLGVWSRGVSARVNAAAPAAKRNQVGWPADLGLLAEVSILILAVPPPSVVSEPGAATADAYEPVARPEAAVSDC